MKKFKKALATLLAILTLAGSACASQTHYWVSYSCNEPPKYLVNGYDDEEKVFFTSVCDGSQLSSWADAGFVLSAYVIDVDGVYEVTWDWSEDGYIFYIFDCHGCEVETWDALPQIH